MPWLLPVYFHAISGQGENTAGSAAREMEERSVSFMPVDEVTKRKIDRWIEENKLNPFGDPPGTMYAGGTPLFDERTGRNRDRYEYILDNHPDLKKM